MAVINGSGSWSYETKINFQIRMPRSSSSYSVIVEGQKEFLKNLCFILKIEILRTFFEVQDQMEKVLRCLILKTL